MLQFQHTAVLNSIAYDTIRLYTVVYERNRTLLYTYGKYAHTI